MPDSLTIDGFGPLPVCRPANVAELGDLVREAASTGQGLYPVGGGTTLDLGLPPTKSGFAVDTRGLDRVIDYPARDMTVTAQAGITMAALQALLAAEGQRLPVDVPAAERATLGGALAANLSGPRRLGRGTLRDYVIGISFVTDAGDEVKGGGRVVKNVAGYDLMKLHVGALGTLGVVTQVTLKVFPTPEDQALVVFGLSAAAVGPTLDRLHTSASRPAAVELLNTAAATAVGLATTSPWVIVVGFEEKKVTVDWQVATLLGELKSAPVRDLTEFRGPACKALWAALTDLQRREESTYIWKANVLPSRVAEFASRVAPNGEYLTHAHALNGIVWLHGSVEFDPAHGSALSWMDQSSAHAGGTQTVRRCPVEWKKTLRVWGRPRGDWDLMREVKTAIDPKDVFNPGRLLADL